MAAKYQARGGGLVRAYIGVYQGVTAPDDMLQIQIHGPINADFISRLYWRAGEKTFRPDQEQLEARTLDKLITKILTATGGFVPRILPNVANKKTARFLRIAGYVPLDPARRKWARQRMLQLYQKDTCRKRYKAPLHRLIK